MTAMFCLFGLAVIGFPLALAASLQDEEDMVCDSEDCPELKSLLQGTLPHSTVPAKRGALQRSMVSPHRAKHEDPPRTIILPQLAREACPLDISGVANAPGNSESLNEAGFENVRACCCPAQMRQFIRRLVQADTNVVCHEGGLGGLTLFYYCNDNYPGNDFDKLVASIGSDSDAQNGACPWIGFGPQKSLCPPQNQDPTVCRSFPGVTEQPCTDCESSTTTTTTTTPAEVVSLTMEFDNMDYDAFANDTDLRLAFIDELKQLISDRFPCPPCRPLTPEELLMTFEKGSVIVKVSTLLVSQSCTATTVISDFSNWGSTTLESDVTNAMHKVPDIGKAVTGGGTITGISGVIVKEDETPKAEPCPHDFPWCNNGFHCEKAWCRYYGGCKADSYRISRSCSSQYVPKCTVPSRPGYDLNLVGGTTTISGFNPSGVACAAGYVGKVSYTVCPSAETSFSVSGCQEVSSISYPLHCNNCYCADVAGHSVRTLLGTDLTQVACQEACNDDPDCGYINYYQVASIHFNCYSCPLSGWVQTSSDNGGDIYSKSLITSDWYGAPRPLI